MHRSERVLTRTAALGTLRALPWAGQRTAQVHPPRWRDQFRAAAASQPNHVAGDGMAVEEPVVGYGAEAAERSPNPLDDGKYVYCIIECAEPRSFGRMGIGGRNDEVYTISYGGLAAVVSDTPVVVYDPTRENALTHERVIDTVLKEFTVIPMSFGAIFRTHDDVVEFLKDTADALRDVLQKM